MAVRLKVASAVVLLALVAAGCGGDDSGAAKGTTTTAGSDKTTTTTAASSDDGGSSNGGGLAGILDKDCQFLLTGSYLNPLAAATAGKGDDVKNAASYLDEVAADAPAEIKDDLQTVATAVSKVSEALKGVDLTNIRFLQDPKVQEKLQSLQSTFSSSDFEAASQHVNTWIKDNCGRGN